MEEFTTECLLEAMHYFYGLVGDFSCSAETASEREAIARTLAIFVKEINLINTETTNVLIRLLAENTPADN